MQDITLKQLLEAGCHFGHKAERWHPKADKFIYQKREGIHIIDLAKTKTGLIKTSLFLQDLGRQGKTVLFVGTKKQAASIVKENAEKSGIAFITKRWIGGFLTNWEQVHKNLEKIRKLKEDQAKDGWKKYPKHERVKLGRYLSRLESFYGGVLSLTRLPDAVFVIDIKRENIAVKEAKKQNIPVAAMVDTNSDPTEIDYVIPANDDAIGSIKVIVDYLAKSFAEGRQEFEKNLVKDKKPVVAEIKKAVEVKKEPTVVIEKKIAPPVKEIKKIETKKEIVKEAKKVATKKTGVKKAISK